LIDRVPEDPEPVTAREPDPAAPPEPESASPHQPTPEPWSRQRVGLIIGVVVVVAALAIGGYLLFGSDSTDTAAAPSSAPITTPLSVAPEPAPTGPLPAPEALTDVLYKIVDPAVPGDQKIPLVEAASGDYAARFDQFSKALGDNGFLPIDIAATNVAWASHPPGNVTADVSIKSQNPALANGFTFPMEFRPTPDGGWQLSRTTADILLKFAQDPATPTPPPTPTG
jgi:hypothetical protein